MEIKCDQRSDEWWSARIGRLTSSVFKDIMPSPRARVDWTEAQLKILRQVAAERLTREAEDAFTTMVMQWGIDNEPIGRGAFAANTMEEVRECGFFAFDEWIGSSPDGIITRDGEDWGTLEIKCPTSKQHLLYLLDSDELVKEYRWQMTGQVLCTGLQHNAICSYDPRFKDATKQTVIVRDCVDPNDIDKLKSRLDEAVEIIKGWL